jgi:hypothetical protein
MLSDDSDYEQTDDGDDNVDAVGMGGPGEHAHKLKIRQFGCSGSSRTSPRYPCIDSDSANQLKADQLDEKRTGEC